MTDFAKTYEFYTTRFNWKPSDVSGWLKDMDAQLTEASSNNMMSTDD